MEQFDLGDEPHAYFVDSSAKNVKNFVLERTRHCDGDAVDTFVVVVAADREIGANVDRTDAAKCRCLSDFRVEVHLESNEHSNRNLRAALLLLLRQTNNLSVVVDSCDVGTRVDGSNDSSDTDSIRSNFDVHTAMRFGGKCDDIHAW